MDAGPRTGTDDAGPLSDRVDPGHVRGPGAEPGALGSSTMAHPRRAAPGRGPGPFEPTGGPGGGPRR